MNPDPDAQSPNAAELRKSLTKALGQSEHVRELVKESAEELSSVNTALKQEIANHDPLPGVANALEKSEAIEEKVDEAAAQLLVVNRALEHEVKDREILDHQIAAAAEQENKTARYASFRDVLTGLPNRALFNDRLEHGIVQAKRHQWTLAVMLLDLDRFRKINDAYGYEAGDSVLKTVAQRLKESARGEDTVCRLGGDEFLYLLMEIREEQSIAFVAEKIICAIQAPLTVSVGDRSVSLSVKPSIGISIFPKDGATVDTLVISADLAMHQAKRSKSRFSIAR